MFIVSSSPWLEPESECDGCLHPQGPKCYRQSFSYFPIRVLPVKDYFKILHRVCTYKSTWSSLFQLLNDSYPICTDNYLLHVNQFSGYLWVFTVTLERALGCIPQLFPISTGPHSHFRNAIPKTPKWLSKRYAQLHLHSGTLFVVIHCNTRNPSILNS